MTEKTVNYPQELTDKIVAAFVACETDEARKDCVEALSVSTGKGVKSIRQKLVREGVYIKPGYVSKAGAKVERKGDIVIQLANLFDVSEDKLNGLEKATKGALETIRACYLQLAKSLEPEAETAPETEEIPEVE